MLILVTTAAASVTIQLPPEKLTHCNLLVTPNGTLPGMVDAYAATTAGYPSLPQLPWVIQLPTSEEALSLTYTAEWETISSNIFVPSLAPPTPLFVDVTDISSTPNQQVYSSDSFWPEHPVHLTGNGFQNGLPVAEALVTPLRWNPETGELQKLISLEIELETEQTTSRPFAKQNRNSTYENMLIVTDSSLESIFEYLAERRTNQGILTEVVTMSEVYAVSSGRDDAEKLRNYIKDYYTQNGLTYLLLGGDTNLVPFRYAYAMTCEGGYHSREDSLPCDLYFSDLDGSWDANGNDIFGEVDDNIDLYTDVFVGRATVETVTEAQIFVNNISYYEDFQHNDFYQNVLFLADVLWTDPYTDSGISKNYIEEHFLPGFLNITKLYKSLGNENLATTMAALNAGQNLINHDGHAWYSSLGVGDDYMGYSDIDAINSDHRYAAVMYSIGCWGAAYDFDAIAEHFITNQNGGCIGYIGNSSYGWGSPGNPLYGYSDALDHKFFDFLYADWSLTSGELLALTKEYFIPYSSDENVYRWHQYDVNLLGDPSFRPYRETVSEIDIICPEIVTANTTTFPVTVITDNPEGLTVCISDENQIWQVTELNATGYISFELESQVSGSIQVTVTGPGIKRTSIEVNQSNGPDPVISNVTIDDSAGYNHLSPDCSADLTITLLNQGNENLTNTTLSINSIEGPATISQSNSSFGDIAATNSSAGAPALSVTVNSSANTGEVVVLNGTISSDQGDWGIVIPFLIYAPGLYFTTYSIDDEVGGNNNNIPEPGETFYLDINISNLGLLAAQNIGVKFIEFPAWVTFTEDSAWVNTINPDSIKTFNYEVTLDSSAPSPSFPWLYFDITSSTTGYETLDTLRLTVGETGISNDVESGETGWTHSGTGDMWNITDTASHSTSHSWFCGDASGYENNMNCGLISPELILAPNASIEFWTTFDVAIYGCDGIYVLVHDISTSTTDTLAFIGSGGALGYTGKNIETGWVPYSFDLSEYQAGTTMQLEFRFSSDNDGDTGNGFYIDDISIEGAYTGSAGNQSGDFTPTEAISLPFPNPAQSSVSVHLFTESNEPWNLGLYNISGRLEKEISGQNPVNNLFNLSTEDLTPGVYFLRFSADIETSRKLVILR